MTLTPSVGTGQIITSTWGNEIRDRSFQQFANKAELDTWAAPDGSMAWTVDTLNDWRRIGGVWRPWPDRGRNTVTTDATGAAVVPHKLGVAPTIVLLTAFSPAVWMANSIISATNFTVRAFTGAGTAYVGSLTFSWIVYP